MKKKHALQATLATTLLLQPMSAFAQTNETPNTVAEEEQETGLESTQAIAPQQPIEPPKEPVQEQQGIEASPPQEQTQQENKPAPQTEETQQEESQETKISDVFPDLTIAKAVADTLQKAPEDNVTQEELQQITRLRIYNDGAFTSLQGFHSLPNLEDLSLYANPETDTSGNDAALSIDLSNNKKLKRLGLSNLGIDELSLSENKNLQSLHVENNDIAVLDVSNLPELKALSVVHNGTKELRLPTQSKLEILHIPENDITSLDLQNQVALHTLFAEHNALTSVQFNPNVRLETVQLNNNALTDLPNINTTDIIYLNIEENKFDLKNGPFAQKHIELLRQDPTPKGDDTRDLFGYVFDYQFSANSERPDAPAVFVDLKQQKVFGLSEQMEFSLDEGKTWHPIVPTDYTKLPEGSALIRYKKTDAWPESESTKLVFSQTNPINNGNNHNSGNTNGTTQIPVNTATVSTINHETQKNKSLPNTGAAIETAGLAGILALLGAWFFRRKAKQTAK